MMGGRSNQAWIAEYAASHQNSTNRACHTVGVPLIVVSIALMAAGIFSHLLLHYGAVLFILGWALQFVGHAFERKQPEFFHDWRFLLVGVQWWWAKMRGKA